MKKIFIVGGLLLAYHPCIASDFSDSKNKDQPDLSKTHKPYIVPETGETVFYPEKYENYQVFKQDYVTKLLAERLEILCSFKKPHNTWSEEDCLYQKDRLDRNEIVLMNNATNEVLERVFGKTYDNRRIQIDHIRNIAGYLRERFLDDGNIQRKLEALIKKCQVWEKEEDGDIPLTPIKPSQFYTNLNTTRH